MIVMLPWKVVCNQAVNTYSVRILGSTPMGCVLTATNFSAQNRQAQLRRLELFRPCRGVVLSSRSCCSPRVTERYQRSQRVSRLQQMISSVRLPTALVSAPRFSPDRCVVSSPLLPKLSRRDATVNAVPRSSGTLASLAKQSNKLLQPVTTRMGKCSSPPLVSRNSFPNQYFT